MASPRGSNHAFQTKWIHFDGCQLDSVLALVLTQRQGLSYAYILTFMNPLENHSSVFDHPSS